MRHAIAAALAALLCGPAAAQPVDETPRIAVLSAYAPEWERLRDAVEDSRTHELHGMDFVTGKLEGQDVLLFLSGISMVNAAMTTQMALENFEVTGLLFSGIAGGVDPELDIGDVVVAERWGQYLDAAFARETEDGYALPPWMSSDFPNHGMIFTRNLEVPNPRTGEIERRFWFDVDADYLARAERAAASLTLEDCAEGTCLSAPPEIVVGGNGVSGTVFVDNAEFRRHTHGAFDASVLDMESAAVAHVAHVNEVPFIAFRSLSDLAGGGEGANELETFLALAAGNSAALVRAFLAEGE